MSNSIYVVVLNPLWWSIKFPSWTNNFHFVFW